MKSAVALFAAAVALLAPAAQGQDDGRVVRRMIGFHGDGSPRYGLFHCRADGRCTPHRFAHYARLPRQGARVYGYVRREEEEGCREIRRVVGDQHMTVDGAKKAANDAWAGAVRFHLGEKFMDLSYARHISYTCSRSSIKEGGVTTLGQTLTRCEIEAQPCQAPREGEK